MRTPFVFLAGLLAAAACGPTPNVVYVPAPVPVREPTPVVAELPPVGITIARVDDARMLVSTNQPAYVAVFEIIPDRGVSLVYPTMRSERRMVMTGSSWVTLASNPMRELGRYASDDRYDRYDRVSRQSNIRYLYAIASDRPLRLNDSAFDDDDYLRDVLGARDYRATDPYRTMDALSRRLVPPGRDAGWGEDLATLDVERPAPVMRVSKVYCPDGSVIYVRDDMADRAVCWGRGHGRGPGEVNHPAPRPDSVVASSGQPVPWHKAPEKMAPPVFRIPTRTDVGEGVLQQGGPEAANHGHGKGDGGVARGDSSSTDGRQNGHQDNGHQDNGHQDNGNHWGRDGGKPANGNSGNANGTNANGNGADNANHGGNGTSTNGHANDGHRPAASDTAAHAPVKAFMRGAHPAVPADSAKVKP